MSKPVAVYCRVSSDEQVENTSLDDQARRCRMYAEQRGWTVVEEFREHFTGTRSDRPEWQRLLEMCRAGSVEAVIVIKWDRVARSTRVGIEVADQLVALNVGLVVIESDLDLTTANGRMMRNVLLSFAEFERDQLVGRMALGQHAMARNGFWPSGGAAPFGYRATGGRTNTLVIHEPEAAIIRDAVAMIVDEGLTTGEVCRRLNAAGRSTKMGRRWTHQHLRRILTQRVLIGQITWANTAKSHRSYRPSGKYGPPVELRFEPIISEDRFAALQDAMARRAYGTKSSSKPYPLSGRLVCKCGEPFGGVYRRDRDLRQYRCRGSKWTPDGGERCDARLIEADWIEQIVWDRVSELLGDRAKLMQCVADYVGLRASQLTVEDDEVARLDRRVTELERALVRATKAALLVEDSVLDEACRELQEDLRAARQRRVEVESWREASAAESRRMRDVWVLADTAAKRLPHLAPARRAEILSVLDVKVVVEGQPPQTPRRGGAADRRVPWRPSVRIVGSVPHEQLLAAVEADPGNPAVAGTPPA